MPRKLGSQGFSRKYVRSELGRAEREQLKQIKAAARELRASARRAIREARASCLLSVRPELDREDERFDLGVKGLRRERRARKLELRSPCYVGALRGALSSGSSTQPDYLKPAVEPFRAARAADEDLTLRRTVARSERHAAKKQRPRRTAGEILREEDDKALREIPEELHRLWHQVKGQLKSSKRRSRAEAFFEWVESHPNEVAAVREARRRDDERQLERELAEEQARRAQAAYDERTPRVSVRRGPLLLGPANPVRVLEAEIEEDERREREKKRPTRRSRAKVRAKEINVFESAELDDIVEHAMMKGTFLYAWRVGDLEVVSTNGTLYIAPPGQRVVALHPDPNEPTNRVVERWIREQTKQKKQKKPPSKGRKRAAPKEGAPRPFVAAHAAEIADPRALPPAAPSRFLLPAPGPRAPLESASRSAPPEAPSSGRRAGVQIEERDGRVLLRFDERPRVELREQLKRAGFRWWSPTLGNQPPAWVAPATDANRRVALKIAEEHDEGAPARSDYEEKRTGRIERLKTRAQRLTEEANATIERARKMADVIPLGQPIHVGHYSEGADRRYRAKIDKTFRKGFEMTREAREAERRARSAEWNTAISSDDPEAIEKLRAKLTELERVRDCLPEARAILKRAKDPRGARAALLALGLDEALVARLTPGPPLQRYAVASLQRNLTGEVQRVRRRIEDIERRQAAPPRRDEHFGGVRIAEEDNRVRIYFEGRPSEEIRKALRGHGFLWAPSVGAWQRKASETAWYWARNVLGRHAPQPASAAPPSAAAPVLRLQVVEPPPGRPEGAGRLLTAQERTGSLFGQGGPVPPPAVAAEGPPRETGPDWLLTAHERTGSLFGAAGPVPPLPGQRRALPQARLPFTR